MKTRYKVGPFYRVGLFLLTSSFWNISCAHHKRHKHHKKESVAIISPVNKSQVRGWVHFQKIKRKTVLVRAEITGLSPNKKHGFHIHQYGDCRNDGQNAGTHWNPKGHPHGSVDSKKRHWGDLSNLIADSKGKALYEKEVNMCLHKVGGRSVIIHAHPDDLKTQPSGKAGPYMACGVIGYVQPKYVQPKQVSKPLLKATQDRGHSLKKSKAKAKAKAIKPVPESGSKVSSSKTEHNTKGK